MKKTLEEFDSYVDKFMDDVMKKSDKLSFENSIEFVLNDEFKDSVFDSIKNEQGIYLFELNLLISEPIEKKIKFKTKLKKFEDLWSTYKTKYLYSPNIIKKRLKTYDEQSIEEWLPMYIGKSEH